MNDLSAATMCWTTHIILWMILCVTLLRVFCMYWTTLHTMHSSQFNFSFFLYIDSYLWWIVSDCEAHFAHMKYRNQRSSQVYSRRYIHPFSACNLIKFFVLPSNVNKWCIVHAWQLRRILQPLNIWKDIRISVCTKAVIFTWGDCTLIVVERGYNTIENVETVATFIFQEAK